MTTTNAPLVYHATRLQLVHTRKGALRCWAFGRASPDEPEVMVGQLLLGALEKVPADGLFRLWAGRDAGGRPVYEDAAVLQIRPEKCGAAREWLALALAEKAPHVLVVE